MAVWYRQTVDGEITDGPREVEPHYVGQSDAELLGLKAQGAADKGWTVDPTGPSSFTATKVRWAAEAACVRDFWAD
jgi:hypothetical protein